MPKLTIKTEYVEKLKKLGCYDEWLANVKAAWGTEGCWLESPDHEIETWWDVINLAFTWDITPEGKSFWEKIADQ